MPVQHSQQHGQPVLVQPQGNPTRITQMTGIHQRLHFNQHGA